MTLAARQKRKSSIERDSKAALKQAARVRSQFSNGYAVWVRETATLIAGSEVLGDRGGGGLDLRS